MSIFSLQIHAIPKNESKNSTKKIPCLSLHLFLYQSKRTQLKQEKIIILPLEDVFPINDLIYLSMHLIQMGKILSSLPIQTPNSTENSRKNQTKILFGNLIHQDRKLAHISRMQRDFSFRKRRTLEL